MKYYAIQMEYMYIQCKCGVVFFTIQMKNCTIGMEKIKHYNVWHVIFSFMSLVDIISLRLRYNSKATFIFIWKFNSDFKDHEPFFEDESNLQQQRNRVPTPKRTAIKLVESFCDILSLKTWCMECSAAFVM